MASEVSSKPSAAGPQPLRTVYVPLNHKHHEHANVLYGLVGNPPESLPKCFYPEYLEFYHNVMKAVDMVVAQHAVAKVSGTVDGFTLVTGVLAPQDHPTLALANCALHILRVARQMILPNGEPLQLKMGLHVGEAYTGMLGTSPPHFQVLGSTVRAARSLAEQGVSNFLQISTAARDALGPVASSSSNWFGGGAVTLWPGEKVDVSLTCCDFQKAQMSELLKVLLPRSRFAEPGGLDQTVALTFKDGELEDRFDAWFEIRTNTVELWGSLLLVLCSVMWLYWQWQILGGVAEVSFWVLGINLVSAALVVVARRAPTPSKNMRSMLWISQYAIISQQVVTNMLRSSTVAGLEPCPGGTPLERLLLQGTYALLACSAVHRVRFVMHAWTTPVLSALAGMAFVAHHVAMPGTEAAAMGHWAGCFCAIVMLSVPAIFSYISETLVRQSYLLQLDNKDE